MKKVLDMSVWQGNVDFAKIKQAGYEYVILRAGYGQTKDTKFDTYASSCKAVGLKIGAYYFSYAISTAEAIKEAQKCVEIVRPYTIDLPIFYDLEGDSVNKAKQRGVQIGRNECTAFTDAFCIEIKRHGYTPGYYANENYYRNMYSDTFKKKGYVFWYAHYKNDRSYHAPNIPCDFFQYSDQGKVPGISSTYVDLDVCLNEKYLNCNQRQPEGGKPMGYTKEQAINAVINIAAGETGYLEKKSNSQLDNKTSNAGYANYTKYWRDIKPDYQGQPWCAAFVSWVFMKAFGLDAAKVLLKHWPYVYCPTLGAKFTKYANPQRGDIVIFWRNNTFAHTGIVTKVDGDRFWTVEGNTSGAAGIEANGGGVFQKSYYNSNLPGTKFCRVDWEYAAKHIKSFGASSSQPSQAAKSYLSEGDKGTEVKTLQTMLIALGYSCGAAGADGDFGTGTDTALRKFQAANGLTVDGQYGAASKAKLTALYSNKGKYVEWNAKCTASLLNIRTGAGVNYPLVNNRLTISSGKVVRVVGEAKSSDGKLWYKVVVDNKYTGYGSAQYLTKA